MIHVRLFTIHRIIPISLLSHCTSDLSRAFLEQSLRYARYVRARGALLSVMVSNSAWSFTVPWGERLIRDVYMLGVLNISSDLQLVVSIALEFGLSLGRLELRFNEVFLGKLVGFLGIFGAWEGFFLLNIGGLFWRSGLFVINFSIDWSRRSFKAMIRLLSSTGPINPFRVHLHIGFWMVITTTRRQTTLIFVLILPFLRWVFVLVLFAAAHYDYNNHNDHWNTNSHTNAYAQLLICSEAACWWRAIGVVFGRIRVRNCIVIIRISNIRLSIIIGVISCWRIVRINTKLESNSLCPLTRKICHVIARDAFSLLSVESTFLIGTCCALAVGVFSIKVALLRITCCYLPWGSISCDISGAIGNLCNISLILSCQHEASILIAKTIISEVAYTSNQGFIHV